MNKDEKQTEVLRLSEQIAELEQQLITLWFDRGALETELRREKKV